jgi:ABC-2 type transport system permease protein
MQTNKIAALALREVLQHSRMWAWLMAVPPVLAVLVIGFGNVQTDADFSAAGPAYPTAMTAAVIAGSSFVMFLVMLVGSLVTVSGLARRDHGDRSVEFWLSMPTPHGSHFGVPLVVHLLLAPAVALVVGWIVGWAVSAVLVTRLTGFGDWLAQPFWQVLPASLALLVRVLAGLPIALLWLAPALLLLVLLNAYVGRWAVGLFALIVGLGSLVCYQLFGQPLPALWVQHVFNEAATSLVGASGGIAINDTDEGLAALRNMPGWSLMDFGVALRDAASPLMAGGLAAAAALFVGLVVWRRKGAGL